MTGAFTIDLTRELDHIARRQHLNAVQDLVLLTRAALRAGARDVRVERSGSRVTLSHDGDPPSDEEIALLALVLGDGAERERHRGLAELERAHGIALLSLFVDKSFARVVSRRSFEGGGGHIREIDARDTERTRITFDRDPRLAREERRELAFYARHADVPIVVDGRALPRIPVSKLLEPRALLGARMEFDDDTLWCTLVDKSRSTRIRFLDHGMFFGVRARSPNDPVPIDVVVNSRARAFDENYRQAIERGQRAAARAEHEALALLASRAESFDHDMRKRARAIVTGLSARTRERQGLDAVPLFDTVSGALLPLVDVEREARARGALFYVSRSAHGALRRRLARALTAGRDDPRLLLLDDEEAFEIARTLAVHAHRTEAVRADRPSTTLPAAVVVEDPDLVRLADALVRTAHVRVRYISGARSILEDDARGLHLGLGVDDAVVKRAAALLAERPDLTRLVEARLVGHARASTARA